MKKQILVVALVLAASIALASTALAQTPAPVPPTCSQALDQLAAARAMPTGDVGAKQTAVDLVKLVQVGLDKVVAEAQKAFDTNVDPTKVAALQAALNEAKAAAAAGGAKVDAAVKLLDADKKVSADRDKAIAAAQAAVDKACKGDPGTTVTVTPPAPVVVTVPNAINTGRG